MPEEHVIGWDLGGAHLKAAVTDAGGRVVRVRQLPCPLWLGLDHLDRTMRQVLDEEPDAGWHSVTMTGELSDLFSNRARGVDMILSQVERHLPARRTLIFAGLEGFLSAHRARGKPELVASANWIASARVVAVKIPDALFVDIGSTTTDIVPIRGGAPAMHGLNDRDRLACEELVYSGLVRTPIMALTDRIPFEGEWIVPMAEHFATAADVYRLTGELPDDADQLPAADNSGKTLHDSARRLARMVGRDLESAPMRAWKQCARYLADVQLWRIRQACERVLSRGVVSEGAPIVGAGVGSLLVRKLADRLKRRFRDFDELVPASAAVQSLASRCAPAVAVALLARQELRARRIARVRK
jgi:probable H4MPT-linked C1 transfer pathway protein